MKEDAAERGHEVLGLARLADARHWAVHKRPIAADTLRTELKISMERARELVTVLRAELAGAGSSKVTVCTGRPSLSAFYLKVLEGTFRR
ncbi:hypothetical protein [Lentzea sp. E54]|uniref:hypothetical protein n=1 Tax=Lentzea xerophila TaxID=3435883 RepID=UPI003DA29F82